MPDPRAAAPRPLRVLFLCTGNSCRSQMAEGFARALLPNTIEAHSAGTAPQGLNPLAVHAMAEAGVDISRHASKRPEHVPAPIDLVITVCDAAHEACPIIPGARTLHAPFADPPRLAAHAHSINEALPHYRRVRDDIRRFIESLPALLAAHIPPQKDTAMTNNSPAPRSCGCGPTCCTPAAPDSDTIHDKVREGYAHIARSGSWSAAQSAAQPNSSSISSSSSPSSSSSSSCAPGGGCCGPATFTPDQLAAAIGYANSDLASVPDGANMGLSCGNPVALASLRPGEVVLDLGSGGGFDCFVAGPRVGPRGRVIGVDMTPDMLAKARRNTAPYRSQSGLDNVEFRLGEIENLPVADSSVDVVISNCVLNLSPDKPRVWREIARVLRRGGRVSVSDLALLRPLPDSVRADVEALVGCIAGAALVEETRAWAAAAGLADIRIDTNTAYIDAMHDWQDPLYRRIVESLPPNSRPSDFITSASVSAIKRA